MVITHPAPLELAEKLSSRLIERWANEFVAMPPHEVAIADGIKSAAKYLQARFGMPAPEASLVSEHFVEDLQAQRTVARSLEKAYPNARDALRLWPHGGDRLRRGHRCS